MKTVEPMPQQENIGATIVRMTNSEPLCINGVTLV